MASTLVHGICYQLASPLDLGIPKTRSRSAFFQVYSAVVVPLLSLHTDLLLDQVPLRIPSATIFCL